MFRDGVFVPPNCPAEPRGELPDLRSVPFAFRVGNCTPDGRSQCTETEILVGFGEAGEHGDYPDAVESASLVVPINSTLAAKARRIIGSNAKDAMADATENARVARVRDMFCSRVANCRGAINGECWALGTAGVQEVIEQA